MDIEKAIQFIKKNGGQVEQARLNYLLFDESPSEEIIAKLFDGQRADGGWPPPWAEDYSGSDATCFRLAQAWQLGITIHDFNVLKAGNFLAGRQSPDGSWEEEERVSDIAPPWAKPGDLSARLYITANCGLWLALLGDPERRASKAAGYLETYLDTDGRLPGYFHTHWLTGGLFYKLGRPASTRIFDYLASRIGDLAPSNLAWLITTLNNAGVPTSHPLLEQAAASLEGFQQEAGYWESEDGPSQNVRSTLEALRALSLCGRIKKE